MSDYAEFLGLWIAGLIPLYTVLAALTWVLHDYLVTLYDEIRYIWPQKRSLGKILFLWMRYYTIILLLFDTIQIHLFRRPGTTSDTVCVVMDAVIRVVGAISLWSVEIIMQLRIYALYGRSKKIAILNGLIFSCSIAAFVWILGYNAVRRKEVIKDAMHLPLPGCPVIHTGIEWVQWVPATAYEGVLLGFAMYKTISSSAMYGRRGERIPLLSLVLRDNVVYFLIVACLLVFNNLMVLNLKMIRIPWFSYSPFHAALGILTCRMLLNLRKATPTDTDVTTVESETLADSVMVDTLLSLPQYSWNDRV